MHCHGMAFEGQVVLKSLRVDTHTRTWYYKLIFPEELMNERNLEMRKIRGEKGMDCRKITKGSFSFPCHGSFIS
jgi:hypothetical protein